MRATLAWTTDHGDSLSAPGEDPTASAVSFVPGPGSTRFIVMQFPPDSVYDGRDFDGAAAATENLDIVPGLAEKFEPEAPGMHTTDTVDYCIVLDGEPVLELDDGRVKALAPGDIVIQNGTRHAWRNPTDSPTTIAFVLVGTPRSITDAGPPPDEPSELGDAQVG